MPIKALQKFGRLLTGFPVGLTTPARGFGYMMRHPGLWRYAIAPIILNLLITLLVLALFIASLVAYVTWFLPAMSDTWLGMITGILMGIAMVVLALGGSFALWLILQGVLVGHFYGILAEHVERELGFTNDEIGHVTFAQQIADTAIDLSLLISVTLLLLLLNIVPVFGGLAALALGVSFNSWLLGNDFMGHALGIRGMRRRQRRQFCWEHLGHTLGLGLVCLWVALIPLVSSVLLTTAVVGGVLLCRDLRARDAAAP